jgi:hypothetical protein
VPTPTPDTRATGEVLTVEQSSNNDKRDAENTTQVLAELKKQQREPPFKAPQTDEPVQYTVLAEIPATNQLRADAHTQHKQRNMACINRAPLRALPRQLQAALHQLPHRVLLRATPSTTCAAKTPWSAPTASTAWTAKAARITSVITPPPPLPSPRGLCSGVLFAPCYKPKKYGEARRARRVPQRSPGKGVG